MSKTTVDHGEIRRWVEERGGAPAIVKDTRYDGAMLRVDFGDHDEGLEQISWDEFFRIFDESGLAFLCQEETAEGERSYFFKFVTRDHMETENEESSDKNNLDRYDRGDVF